MFIKIIVDEDRKGVSDKKVIPYTTHLFEAIKVVISKYYFESEFEYNHLTGRLVEDYGSVYIIKPPSFKDKLHVGEFVFLQMINGSNEELVICSECVIYHLNNDGRTIDSLRCN